MKIGDIRDLSTTELEVAGRTATEELFKLRFQHHTGQLNDTAALRRTRQKLARVNTILNERARGIDAQVREA